MSFFTNTTPNRRYGTPTNQQQQRPPLSGAGAGGSSAYRYGSSPSRMTNAKTNALFDALISGALQHPLSASTYSTGNGNNNHNNQRRASSASRNTHNNNDHRATPKSHELASINLLRQSLLETTSALEEARRRCHELTLRNEHLAHELNQVKDENSRIYSAHSSEMSDARAAVERANERLRTISAREEDARAEAAHWRRRAIENGISNTASGVSAFVSSPPPTGHMTYQSPREVTNNSYYSPLKSSANALQNVTATALPPTSSSNMNNHNHNTSTKKPQQQLQPPMSSSSRATSMSSSNNNNNNKNSSSSDRNSSTNNKNAAIQNSNTNATEEDVVEEPIVVVTKKTEQQPARPPSNSYRNSPSVQAPNLSPTRRGTSSSHNNNSKPTGAIASSLSSSARRYINDHVVADSPSHLSEFNNNNNNNTQSNLTTTMRKPSPATPALVQSPRRVNSSNNTNFQVLSRTFDDSWAEEALELERGMEETKQRLRSVLGGSASMPRSSPARRY